MTYLRQPPTSEESATALDLLGMDPNDVRCAYCGDSSTEWDHLRRLVLNRRPTGHISEVRHAVALRGMIPDSRVPMRRSFKSRVTNVLKEATKYQRLECAGFARV